MNLIFLIIADQQEACFVHSLYIMTLDSSSGRINKATNSTGHKKPSYFPHKFELFSQISITSNLTWFPGRMGASKSNCPLRLSVDVIWRLLFHQRRYWVRRRSFQRIHRAAGTYIVEDTEYIAYSSCFFNQDERAFFKITIHFPYINRRKYLFHAPHYWAREKYTPHWVQLKF